MDKTPFAGLTRLDPGDPLSEDGYSFQAINPEITDFLLRLAVQTHKHDAHAAMLGPTEDPTIAAPDTGGTIPSDTTITVGYTLIDAAGGETELNTTPQVVTTQAGLVTPTDAPTAVLDTAAGTLLAGSYSYAVTITDGFGGETDLGPAVTVIVPGGTANAQVDLSDLTAIVTAAGGTGWRLWRSVNGGQWALINDGATDTITDDGTLCADRGVDPPASATGTTNATNSLEVTVPAGQPAEAVTFRIYASLDGTFASPALLGEYPVADLATLKTFTELAFLDGAPPARSLAMPGASKIDASTDITNLSWKGPVADAAALAAVTGMAAGDVRVQLSDHTLHVYDGAAWQSAGGTTAGDMVLDTTALWSDAKGYKAGSVVMDLIGSWTPLFVATVDVAAPDYGPGAPQNGGGFIPAIHRITAADHPATDTYADTLQAGDPVLNGHAGDVARVYEFTPFDNNNMTITCDQPFDLFDDTGAVLGSGGSGAPLTHAVVAGHHYYIGIHAAAGTAYTVSMTSTGSSDDIPNAHPHANPGVWFIISPLTSDWTAGTFQGAWVTSAAPFSTPAARREILEYNKQKVTLRGGLQSGAAGAAWQLPAIDGDSITPSFRQFFSYGTAKLSVRTDGKVYVDSIGTETDIALDGISYFVN